MRLLEIILETQCDKQSSDTGEQAGTGFGDVSESGPFKDGGVATMFKPRRR